VNVLSNLTRFFCTWLILKIVLIFRYQIEIFSSVISRIRRKQCEKEYELHVPDWINGCWCCFCMFLYWNCENPMWVKVGITALCNDIWQCVDERSFDIFIDCEDSNSSSTHNDVIPKNDNEYTALENPIYFFLRITVNLSNMSDEVISLQMHKTICSFLKQNKHFHFNQN